MPERGQFNPIPYGQYLLLDRIGSGGMAEIFRAKTFGAAGFEKEYAIKRILPNLVADQEFREMFINEAKLVENLYHANIVQVFDLGEIDDTYFIAMEFVYGKDLLDLLARCAERDLKIPLKLTLHIAMEMLKGLDFAHKATDRYGEPLGIIHRDVSPSNVMLSYGGDVKVGDFGVAKARTQTHLTEVGTLKGKVGYMSPEQVRGEVIDHRSDIFAAGIILYECLSMSRLFMGGNDLDVMLKIRDSDIEDELQRCRKVPPTLLDILRRALTKSREDRYQTCQSMYGALRDFVYEHDIKTSNQDLSHFLHLVFEEDVQAEKTRRAEEEANANAPRPPLVRPTAPSASTMDVPAVGRVAPPPQAQPQRRRTGKHPVTLTGSGYYYRGADQSVHGPLALDKMKLLLSKLPEREGEAVSVGKLGDWRSLDDLPELWSVERPRQAFDAALSRVDGAALDNDDTDVGEGEEFSGVDTPISGSPRALGGRLDDVTFARLLGRIDRRRATGMLRVTSADAKKDIFMRRGEPVAVNSNVPAERLGTYLVNRKKITQAQLDDALRSLEEFGGRLGDALAGQRVLGTRDLFRYLSEQLQDRILDVFRWGSGTWSWYANISPDIPDASLGVDFLELVLDGVRNYVPYESVRARFAGREGIPLDELHSRTELADLPLLPDEAEMARRVQPGMTPAEVVAQESGGDPGRERVAWRVLYVLTELALFRLADGEEEPMLP